MKYTYTILFALAGFGLAALSAATPAVAGAALVVSGLMGAFYASYR